MTGYDIHFRTYHKPFQEYFDTALLFLCIPPGVHKVAFLRPPLIPTEETVQWPSKPVWAYLSHLALLNPFYVPTFVKTAFDNDILEKLNSSFEINPELQEELSDDALPECSEFNDVKDP